MVTLQLDLDELESGKLDSLLFGYNTRKFLSVKVPDYLRGEGTLREKVLSELLKQEAEEVPARITLVTMPRLCGYIFNPVSFFICFNQQDQVIACVTQVHNTFGEAHVYPLTCVPKPLPVEWQFDKAFFVSPFFDTEGRYRVVVEQEGAQLGVVVDLFKGGEQVFGSAIRGVAKPLTLANLLKTLIRFPLTFLLTMPRIHTQALVLLLRLKLEPFLKPPPSSPYTIRSQQNRIHKARLWLLSKMRDMRRYDS